VRQGAGGAPGTTVLGAKPVGIPFGSTSGTPKSGVLGFLGKKKAGQRKLLGGKVAPFTSQAAPFEKKKGGKKKTGGGGASEGGGGPVALGPARSKKKKNRASPPAEIVMTAQGFFCRTATEKKKKKKKKRFLCVFFYRICLGLFQIKPGGGPFQSEGGWGGTHFPVFGWGPGGGGAGGPPKRPGSPNLGGGRDPPDPFGGARGGGGGAGGPGGGRAKHFSFGGVFVTLLKAEKKKNPNKRR